MVPEWADSDPWSRQGIFAGSGHGAHDFHRKVFSRYLPTKMSGPDARDKADAGAHKAVDMRVERTPATVSKGLLRLRATK